MEKSLEDLFGMVKDAAARLQGVANRTPVMTSRTLNERLGADVFLKCENFQRIGAFKFNECGTPDFYLGATPTSVPICAGSPAAYDLTVGSIAGFTNPVTLSASGQPAGTSASLRPSLRTW
mgnify:CR=1 FL=1